MSHKKRSFFEKLTGSVDTDDENEKEEKKISVKSEGKNGNGWLGDEAEEAELTVDVYQTPTEIVVQAMIAGVKPDDLDLTIARDMLTIRGKREETRVIDEENYFAKELYWGSFARTILLPQEVEPEETEAVEKHGLLTVKLKKIDRDHKTNVKIKSM